MVEIKCCPSSLMEGFDTYCPKSAKLLFGNSKVNPILGFDIDEFRNVGEIADAMHRISVSGVKEKFPAIINAEAINIAGDNERSTHILKPAPWDKTLRDRKPDMRAAPPGRFPTSHHFKFRMRLFYGMRS